MGDGLKTVGARLFAALLSGVLVGVFGAQPARADDFGTNCAACHAQPPSLPSQNATYGKILPLADDGRLSQSCLSGTPLFNCALRQKLNGEDGSGNIVNATARANMGGLGTTLSNGTLEAIRLYLLKVRDAEFGGTGTAHGSVRVGQTSTLSASFTLSNYRSVDIGYTLSLAGAAPGDYTIVSHTTPTAGCTPGTVPGTSTANEVPRTCVFNVGIRFQPTAAGARNASLEVTTAAAAAASDPNPADGSLPLTGTGTQPAYFELPNPLAITAPVGGLNTGAITISNTGTATLNIGSIAFPARFSRSSGCDDGTALAPGGSCVMQVAFAPLVAGATSGTLTITHDAPGSPSSVTLNGTGTQPVFAAAPDPLSFVAKVGGSGQSTLTISNPGSGALTLASIAFPAGFARAAGCADGTVLVPGDSCQLQIAFSPAVAGATSGALSVTHNAPGSPSSVTLNGTGTQATVSAPATLDFGNSQTGVPKTIAPLTITNAASAPTATLVFTTDAASAGAKGGAHPGDFAFTTSCTPGVAIAALGSCTITGTFTPGAAGARSATLTLVSDAGNSPTVITLSGTGVALPEPTLTAQAAIADFPDTVVGEVQPTARDITITNDRTRDIGYSVANTTNFRIRSRSAGACAAGTVPGGGSCTLSWEFAPPVAGGEGMRTDTLSFSFTGTGGDPAPSSLTRTLSGRALMPVVPSASSLSAAAQLGSTATASLVLTNRKSSAITLASLGFSGAAAGDYAIDASSGCVAGGSVAAGGSCTLVVRFAPTAIGTRNATLNVDHGEAGSPVAVALLGTSTPVPRGRLELSATTVAFPQTQLGSTATQTVTLSNAGTAALTFSAFTLAGTNPADFSTAGTCSTAVPLAIGTTCTLTLRFAPAALGPRSATLTIASDSSTGAATLALSGTGVPVPAPAVSFAPGSIDFGAQTIGGLYQPRSVRLSNTGTADLAIGSLAIQGAGYSLVSGCAATLAPGAGCDLSITFTPSTAGTSYPASLRLTSNAAGSPHSVPLTGRGAALTLPVLAWSPAVTTLDFGNVSAGTVSAPQTAVLANQGPGGTVLGLLNAVGPDAALFVVGGNAAGDCTVGMTLFEGQTCTLPVRFAPAMAGARAATVQVATDGSFPPPLTLTGTGLGGPVPTAGLSATALAFDATRLGAQSLPAELTITSSGSGTLEVSSLAVTGPYAMQLRSCPALPFTLPAGASCTVSVSFVPAAAGTASGTLRMVTSASATPVEVSLSGSGEAAADVSSGGCSLVERAEATDPTLWVLVLLAVAVLAARRRSTQRARRSA